MSLAEERIEAFARSNKVNPGDVDFIYVKRVAWIKPPLGWFKVNFDGYFDPTTVVAVAGFVVRDWEGRLLFAEAQ